ncbi:MAG: RNA methyltransferase [Bacilli bacterium]|nr:RNA methyltransferase [Bacilli bacterium]
MMLYTSINNKKIKYYKQLKQKKFRDKERKFIVEGEHLVKEAYNNKCLLEVLTPEKSKLKIDATTSEISESVIKYLTSLQTPTGIFGICKEKENKLKEGKVLALDGIQDPGNMGTIIRSAAAFNIDTIVVNDKCVDIYSDKVIRASQGLIFSVNIVKKDIKEVIEDLKNNHTIYATKVDGGKTLKDIEKNKNFVIIMGNEGNGVSEELIKLADCNLYIPMNKKCESLNVAVATSIILYEFGGE